MIQFNIKLIVPLLFLLLKEADPSTASFIVLQTQQDNSIEKIEQLIVNEDYTKALQIALNFTGKNKENGNINDYIEGKFLVGKIYEQVGNREQALQTFIEIKNYLSTINLENIDINNNLTENNFSSRLLIKIAGNYQYLKKFDSAKFYNNKLINSNELGLNKDSNLIKAKAYNNLSDIFRREKEYAKAKSYALKAIEIYEKTKERFPEAFVLNNLGSIYLEEEDYSKAVKLYKRGLKIIEKDTTNNAERVREDLYYNLAYTLYLLKDYKAYEYQEKSYDIKDELLEKSYRRAVKEIEAKYNVDAVQQAEENKRLKLERNTWIIGILGVLATLLSLYFVNLFKLRQKNLSLKLSKKELEQQKQLDEIKTQSQVKIINATLDAKVSERKQIAETLHDNISTLLSSANLHLSASEKQFNGSLPEEILKTQDILSEASTQIRNLSHTLISSILLKFGLEYAIKDVAKKYSNSVLEFHTNFNNVKRYAQDFEIKIFNIVQELTNNILKHSEATEAFINLQEKKGNLFIIVRDNGKGFDFNTARNKDGVGLNQIDARIKMLKGGFDVNSNSESGTSIKIKVPVKRKNEVASV